MLMVSWFSTRKSSSAPSQKSSPAYPGTLDYHLELRSREAEYRKTFDHPGYEAWLRAGCPLNNPNPPDIWLAELALTVPQHLIPAALLDLDRMQVILNRVRT